MFWFQVNAWIPQCSFIGPPIAIIFIGDVPENIQNPIIIYTDDYAVYNTEEDTQPRATLVCPLNAAMIQMQTWTSN